MSNFVPTGGAEVGIFGPLIFDPSGRDHGRASLTGEHSRGRDKNLPLERSYLRYISDVETELDPKRPGHGAVAFNCVRTSQHLQLCRLANGVAVGASAVEMGRPLEVLHSVE